MQNILVVMEKNSFLPMSMIEQLKELEYNIVPAQLDIQQLSKLKETYEVVLLFMEGDGEEKTKELVYLRDKAVEEDCPIFYVGEDTPVIRDVLPKHILQEVFERPIDVKASAKKMDEFRASLRKDSQKSNTQVNNSNNVIYIHEPVMGDFDEAVKAIDKDKKSVIAARKKGIKLVDLVIAKCRDGETGFRHYCYNGPRLHFQHINY